MLYLICLLLIISTPFCHAGSHRKDKTAAKDKKKAEALQAVQNSEGRLEEIDKELEEKQKPSAKKLYLEETLSSANKKAEETSIALESIKRVQLETQENLANAVSIATASVASAEERLRQLETDKTTAETNLNAAEEESVGTILPSLEDKKDKLRITINNLKEEKIPEAQKDVDDLTTALKAAQDSAIVEPLKLKETIKGLEESLVSTETIAESAKNELASLEKEGEKEITDLVDKKNSEQTTLESAKKTLALSSDTPSALDPLPIADWLNVSQIKSFFNPAFKSIASREEHFNSIDSLNQSYLEIEPYGFYSNFHLYESSFKLQSFGVTLQGGLNLTDKWVLGGGIGYLHSNLDYESPFKDTNINSLYGGPFVAYLFEKAYLELRLLGVYNFYDIQQQPSEGWDFNVTLEGGRDFEIKNIFGPRFFIQPNMKLDSFMVFQDDNESVNSVKVNQATFFSSRLAVQFLKEFPQWKKWILAPSASIGWVLMQPISQTATCADRFENVAYENSNQAYFEAKLVGIHKKGILLSLGVEAYVAKLYPVYACNLKVGFEW